jgi:hypothetical protein
MTEAGHPQFVPELTHLKCAVLARRLGVTREHLTRRFLSGQPWLLAHGRVWLFTRKPNGERMGAFVWSARALDWGDDWDEICALPGIQVG